MSEAAILSTKPVRGMKKAAAYEETRSWLEQDRKVNVSRMGKHRLRSLLIEGTRAQRKRNAKAYF
jgi:hypothetical protein